jgi:phage/plasmid-associated DNA primase
MSIEIPKQLIDMDFCRVQYKTKKPFEIDWVNKQYTYEQINKYFPKENYGVICGEKVRVLDDDTKENILLNMFLEYFGKTFRVRNHLYFKFDNKYSDKIVFYNEQGEHLGELQGSGTMVVGPGSIHPSGEIYDLREDIEIIEVKYEEFFKIFGKYIKQNSTPCIGKNEIVNDLINDKFLNDIKSKWNKGDRQNLTLLLAGYLRKNKRFGKESVYHIIENICYECNDLDINERLRAVDSTFNKDESQIKGISGLEERDIVNEEDINIEKFLIREYNESGKLISTKVNIDAVAEYIENKFQIRTIFGLREETIEVYDEGIWTEKGRGIIKAEIERLLESYCKNNVVAEVLEKIKRRTETSRELTENIPNYKRCLNNGVLDFENEEDIKLIPYSKEYNFRTKWNIDYNPDAKCDKFLTLIKEALYEQDIEKFQEWNGLHLPRKYTKKKLAIYHGPKDTSKTVMMNHLTIALNHNVCGLTLQDISNGKPFDLLVLKDKDANICDDLSSRDMKAVGGIKKSVGDGFIDGEQKFGDKIRFLNTAKQTYACNKIPNPGEDIDDEAYYGRIILFPFENVIPEDKQDEELINKITTPEELSGWLNWMIEGYKRLKKQNKFTNDLTPEETKYLMIQNGDSLAEFSAQILEESVGNKISKEDMYKVYCDWCINHKPKLSPDTKEKIGRNLTKFAPYTQASSNGSERYWVNVKVKNSLNQNDIKTTKNIQNNDTYYTFQKNMSTFSEGSYSVLEGKNEGQNNRRNIFESVISVSKNNNYSDKDLEEFKQDLEELSD